MEEKRMVGDYTVTNSMYIGHKEVILAENSEADKGERYLCCYVENNIFFEGYPEAVVSDDFAEIVKIYGERMAQAADEILKETETVKAEIGQDDEITKDLCIGITWDDSLENKVIVIKGNILRPEFRRASHQLMLCTGGFGAQPKSRGRTCYCISLYDGRKTSFYRSDVLGVIDQESLSPWAKRGLERAVKIEYENRQLPKERGEAR